MNKITVAILIYYAVIVCIFCLVLFIYNKKNRNTIIRNGIKIRLSPYEYKKYVAMVSEEEEQKKQQKDKEIKKAQQNYNNKCKQLNDTIKEKLNSCDDLISRKVLQSILDIPINNRHDYEYKKWLFNNGSLRTNKEVADRELEFSKAKHRESYDTERYIITFIFGLLFFVGVFSFVFFTFDFCRRLPVIGIPIALLPALFAALIGSAVGHSINIHNASEYDISPSDPRVQKERIAMGVDIASAAFGTISVGKKAKSAMKEISKPDSWKEMQ